MDYSFRQGVKLAVLTNGISWWFYLPLHEGSWEQRKFFTIEIPDQDSEKIETSFHKFLSKKNVLSGKSVEEAEKIHKSAIKNFLVKDTLPEAWNKLITEPDANLIELLAETTEKLCGYKPDNIYVAEFLDSYYPETTVNTPKKQKPLNKGKKTTYKRTGYTGKKINSFYLKDKKYEAQYWINLLIKISELMLELDKENFNKVLRLKGRKRPYFTKNPDELRVPYKIKGTNIHMETNLDANSIVSLSKDIITLFNFNKDDLKIETIEK